MEGSIEESKIFKRIHSKSNMKLRSRELPCVEVSREMKTLYLAFVRLQGDLFSEGKIYDNYFDAEMTSRSLAEKWNWQDEIWYGKEYAEKNCGYDYDVHKFEVDIEKVKDNTVYVLVERDSCRVKYLGMYPSYAAARRRFPRKKEKTEGKTFSVEEYTVPQSGSKVR